MGYRSVGNDYSDLGEPERAREYFTKAFELREHASEREKLAITADYYDKCHRGTRESCKSISGVD